MTHKFEYAKQGDRVVRVGMTTMAITTTKTEGAVRMAVQDWLVNGRAIGPARVIIGCDFDDLISGISSTVQTVITPPTPPQVPETPAETATRLLADPAAFAEVLVAIARDALKADRMALYDAVRQHKQAHTVSGAIRLLASAIAAGSFAS